jgi:hypothetical protein
MVLSRLWVPDNFVILTNCSDVSRSDFAYCIFGLLPEKEEGTVARSSWEDLGCMWKDASRARSSEIGTCADDASLVSFCANVIRIARKKR